MSLPLPAIERLFSRLGTTYGNQFQNLYVGWDPNAVKSAWAHELGGFATKEKMECIAWALENLPERCPNAIEFRNLCRRAPMPEKAKALPPPEPAQLERVQAELAKLRGMTGRPAAPAAEVEVPGLPGGTHKVSPHKAWAFWLVARADAGECIAPACLAMARDVVNRESQLLRAPQ